MTAISVSLFTKSGMKRRAADSALPRKCSQNKIPFNHNELSGCLKKKNEFTKSQKIKKVKPLSKNLIIRNQSRAGLLQICSDVPIIGKAVPRLKCIPNPHLSRFSHVLKFPGV